MGEDRQEEDGRLGKEGFQDSSMPAGKEADEEAWEEKSGKSNGSC